MISLTYLSYATAPLSQSDLEDLLVVSRELNARDDLTGLLLYAEEQFVQTLEGPEQHVNATMDRIRADTRHHRVDVTWVEEIENRLFPDWSMGFEAVMPSEVAQVRGYSDYLSAAGDAKEEGATPSGHALVFHRWFRDGMRRLLETPSS